MIGGAYDVVIASGIESMSRVPIGSQVAGRDPFGTGVAVRYPDGLVPQGISAEPIAARWKLTREQLDSFAAESHWRAAAAWDDGRFDRELARGWAAAIAADGLPGQACSWQRWPLEPQGIRRRPPRPLPNMSRHAACAATPQESPHILRRLQGHRRRPGVAQCQHAQHLPDAPEPPFCLALMIMPHRV